MNAVTLVNRRANDVGSRDSDARGAAAAACRAKKALQAENWAGMGRFGRLLDSFLPAQAGQVFKVSQYM